MILFKGFIKLIIKKSLKHIVDRFPRIAQLYRNSRDLLDRNSPAIETPWGFTLAGHPIMATGDFEREETYLVRELLREVDILVNIGANVGYYCCHALSLGKPVIAVEPITRNLHYLLRNISENGWSHQAQIFPLAVGAGVDVVKMWGGGTGASMIEGWANIPNSYFTQVPVLTLDRILGSSLRDQRALILVDIEGAEYDMLQGASQTLQNSPRPIWMMEIGSTMHQPSGITVNPNLLATFEVFHAQGYQAQTADAERAVVELATARAVQAGEMEFNTHNFLLR